MAYSSSAAPAIDASIWRAIAGATVQIPTPNSYVYYFPQGHLEQYYGDAAAQISNLTLGNPFITCRVISVGLFYDTQSEQPFAKFLLQPAFIPWRPPRDKQSDVSESEIVCYSKVLTPSDANNGGGFSVPRSCADSIFPGLDYKADPPVQSLTINDALGNAWKFRHIFRGTPRRHLLTTGWSKFINNKLLVARDTVMFMRKKKSMESSSDRYHHLDELFVGIRRAEKYSGSNEDALNKAIEEMKKADKGLAFEVMYYPRVGSPDFVVSAERVGEASRIQWSGEMRVRMEIETDNSTRVASVNGTIKGVLWVETGPWSGSPWRMLKVAWDEPSVALNVERVSPWEVEHIPPEPHFDSKIPSSPKKLKASSSSDRPQQGIQIRDQSGSSNLTFTQLLMRCIESNCNDDDDDYVSQLENNNIGVSSFRLFGQTIETCKSSEGGSTSGK